MKMIASYDAVIFFIRE